MRSFEPLVQRIQHTYLDDAFPDAEEQLRDAELLRNLGYTSIAGICAASEEELRILLATELSVSGSLYRVAEASSAKYDMMFGPNEYRAEDTYYVLPHSAGVWALDKIYACKKERAKDTL